MNVFRKDFLRGQTYSPDVNSYLERIGYNGPRETTLKVLTDIHMCHVGSIPFENVDICRGLPISLNPNVLEDKVVKQRRGGYCYELNSLFYYLLQTMGFEVMPVFARVRWNIPAHVATGNSHVALKVDLDGKWYLADVAFGGIGSPTPLDIHMVGDQVTHSRLDLRRITPIGGGDEGYLHQVQLKGAWKDLYHFTLAECYPPDWEIANWYTSTHPEMIFTKQLMAAVIRKDAHYSLVNRMLTCRKYGEDGKSGEISTREIHSEAELLSVLEEVFGLVYPVGAAPIIPNEPW